MHSKKVAAAFDLGQCFSMGPRAGACGLGPGIAARSCWPLPLCRKTAANSRPHQLRICALTHGQRAESEMALFPAVGTLGPLCRCRFACALACTWGSGNGKPACLFVGPSMLGGRPSQLSLPKCAIMVSVRGNRPPPTALPLGCHHLLTGCDVIL